MGDFWGHLTYFQCWKRAPPNTFSNQSVYGLKDSHHGYALCNFTNVADSVKILQILRVKSKESLSAILKF